MVSIVLPLIISDMGKHNKNKNREGEMMHCTLFQEGLIRTSLKIDDSSFLVGRYLFLFFWREQFIAGCWGGIYFSQFALALSP